MVSQESVAKLPLFGCVVLRCLSTWGALCWSVLPDRCEGTGKMRSGKCLRNFCGLGDDLGKKQRVQFHGEWKDRQNTAEASPGHGGGFGVNHHLSAGCLATGNLRTQNSSVERPWFALPKVHSGVGSDLVFLMLSQKKIAHLLLIEKKRENCSCGHAKGLSPR